MFSAKVSQPQPSTCRLDTDLQPLELAEAIRLDCLITLIPYVREKLLIKLPECYKNLVVNLVSDVYLPNVLILTLCFFCIARVGKTSISLRFVHNKFDKEQMSTVDASFLDKKV